MEKGVGAASDESDRTAWPVYLEKTLYTFRYRSLRMLSSISVITSMLDIMTIDSACS